MATVAAALTLLWLLTGNEEQNEPVPTDTPAAMQQLPTATAPPRPSTPVPTVAPTPVATPAPTDSPRTAAPGTVPPTPAPVASGALTVGLTFYVCTGAPAGYQDGYCPRYRADGNLWPYPGVAACGYGFARGQRFTIDGDPAAGTVYVCDDRGYGPSYWIDVWFGTYAEGRAWRNQLPGQVQIVLLP